MTHHGDVHGGYPCKAEHLQCHLGAWFTNVLYTECTQCTARLHLCSRRAQKRVGCNSEKDRKIVWYRFLGNASFIVFIDLYIVLCSPSFLHSLFLPFPVTAMLPIYSGDLVFFSFVCRSIYVSLRVLFVV